MAKTKYVSVNEAARIKGCSRQAIHNAIQTDRLVAIAEIVEKIEWKICPKSLAQLRINPKMQQAGRKGSANGDRNLPRKAKS